MKKNNPLNKINVILSRLSFAVFILIFHSCGHDARLDNIVVHDNPLIKVSSKPQILLDHLNNPAAPFFIGNRVIFAESGKGAVYEYKQKKAIPLITGFGLDNYAGYSISVLGLASVAGKNTWIVAASQDSGHIFVFDESTFPTTAGKGREIEMERTDATNPFSVLLIDKDRRIVASGGTKSVYQAVFDAVNPNPLKPVYDVQTGVAGMAEDKTTGDILGAVIGSGKNDGYLVRWNPNTDNIQPQTIAKDFSNLVGVIIIPDGLLLLLEFGSFEAPHSGRILVIDPKDPTKSHPLVSGLDSPSGFSLGADNTILISTFGGNRSGTDGMLISLKIDSKK